MKSRLFLLGFLSMFLFCCTKETETIRVEDMKAYYPMLVGHYITYRMDSTVYVNLGTVKEIHTYLVQDKIDSLISDNLGRPSYKIRRTIRSNTDTTKWKDLTSYLVTIDQNKIEVVQDNLRFVKLAEPVTNNTNWNGNSYINTINLPYLDYLNGWRYQYEQVRRPFTANSISYTETISVKQQNDTLGIPSDKSQYFEINYSKEVYAKSIGLIFKEFLHEAWQPANVNSPSGYFEPNSYGIKLTMINHNF